MSDLRKHAPDSKRSPLGIMALISLLLGLLFLMGFKFGALENMEVATESRQRQLDFLWWAGIYLLVQGVGIGLFHIARDPHFATGAGEDLRAKLQHAPLWLRVLYLPRVVFGHRRARGFANAGVQITLGLALFALSNYLFARHELWRIDVTAHQQFTLSDESRALVKDSSAPIRLLTVIPEAGLDPQLVRQLSTLVAQYRDANPRISGTFYDTLSAKDPVEREEKLRALGVTGDLSNDQSLLGVIVQIGKTEAGEFEPVRSKRVTLEELWAPDPNDPSGRRQAFNGEQAITTAILELGEPQRSTIYFLTGHGEPDMGGMGPGGLAYWVERIRERNMQVKSLNLLEEDNVVPEDADLLVVAGPRSPLTREERKGVDEYLARGGDLIFLSEGRYEQASPQTHGVEWLEIGLEDILRDRYGILSKDRIVSVIGQDGRGRRVRTADLQGLFRFSHRHPLVRPLQAGRVHLRAARPFAKLRDVKNVVTEPLLMSLEGKDQLYLGQANPGSSERGLPGPYAFAMASEAHDDTGKTGPKVPSRVVVIGDLDMATTQIASRRSFVNLEFLMNSVQWCLEREKRIVGKVRVKEPTRLVMSKDQKQQIMLIAILGLPALAIAFGIVAWAIRRRT